MRYLAILSAAIAASFPAWSQQTDPSPGPQGIIDQQVLQNAARRAVEKAFQQSRQLSQIRPAGNPLPLWNPAGGFILPPGAPAIPPNARLMLPSVVCAIPLLPVPTADVDPHIVVPSNQPAADSKMIVPTMSACAANPSR